MNKQILMRRYLRNQQQMYSGQPGIDHFNLNAALEKITTTANDIAGGVKSAASAINDMKSNIGANISGIRSAVKSVMEPSTSFTPASPQPNMSYLGNVSVPVALTSNKTLIIALAAVTVVVVVFFVVKK